MEIVPTDESSINEIKEGLLASLTVDVLINIFSYLTSQQVSAVRLVCKKFNKAGKKLLNRRFSFYCSFVPKTLLSTLRNHSVFPNAPHKEVDLHVLCTGLLLLRAVFGLILDHIETITLTATKKQFKWKIIDSLRMRGRNFYPRSINTLFRLIEIAADHFEKHIEPALPAPATFTGTKILDLIATCSELQYEKNDKTFHSKVAARFPKIYLRNMNINTWLVTFRRHIILDNMQWIFKSSRIPMKEITSNQFTLRWNSSHYDHYQTNFNYKLNMSDEIAEGGNATKDTREVNFVDFCVAERSDNRNASKMSKTQTDIDNTSKKRGTKPKCVTSVGKLKRKNSCTRNNNNEEIICSTVENHTAVRQKRKCIRRKKNKKYVNNKITRNCESNNKINKLLKLEERKNRSSVNQSPDESYEIGRFSYNRRSNTTQYINKTSLNNVDNLFHALVQNSDEPIMTTDAMHEIKELTKQNHDIPPQVTHTKKYLEDVRSLLSKTRHLANQSKNANTMRYLNRFTNSSYDFRLNLNKHKQNATNNFVHYNETDVDKNIDETYL